MQTSTELARRNMVENQVRTWEVLDPRVLETLADIPREDFVPARYRTLAFADLALPIGHGELMFTPAIEGRILQALMLLPGESVLEIGSGSGFLSACMAHLGARVLGVERHADLAEAAQARLDAAHLEATIEVADALRNFDVNQSFDAVLVGGAVHALPERLRNFVKPGGRIFAIVGDSPAMQATLYTHLEAAQWRQEKLFETDVPYLLHAEPPRRFAL